MKFFTINIFLLGFIISVNAQLSRTDSLLVMLSKSKQDTARVDLLMKLSRNYESLNPDSSFLFASESLKLAQTLTYKKGENLSKEALGIYAWRAGDYASAVKYHLDILKYYRSQHDTLSIMLINSTLLNSYRDQGDYKEALIYGFLNLDMAHKSFKPVLRISTAMIGSVYYEMNKLDSALFYLNKSLLYPDILKLGHRGWILLMKGKTYAKMKNIQTASTYYHESIKDLSEVKNFKDLAGANLSLGELYDETGSRDSAIYYGKQALNIALPMKFNKENLQAYFLLAKSYEPVDPEIALTYYKLAISTKDSLYNQEKQRQILSYKFNEEMRQQELISLERQEKNRNKIIWMSGVLLIFFLVVVFLVRNNKRKQKVNAILHHQKQELQTTLTTLKATQSQLIQSEKMASLGELTAGIAHEIQNPLNFINNFSEVNKELSVELEEEIDLENYTNAKVIAKDIRENEQKINHHGKRADAIVKGMLQHSRNSKGVKELTNINALADEYLRLAYHGMRAKDKSFNVLLKTDYDETIGNINIIPQDIGRVILNLITNSFYACTERSRSAVNEKKTLRQAQDGTLQQAQDDSYEPTVSVSTKKINDNIAIKVADNGDGIPQIILDKIFQPFFTTKPTGQGTGLGLSLSYDIVKAHGGELMVETKEGEGSTFIIKIPSN